MQEMAMIVVPEKRYWRNVFPGDALVPQPDRKLAAICFGSARIGEFAVGQFFVTCGKPTKTPDGHWLETSECHREARMVSERGKTFDFDEHVRLLQQIVDRYQSEYQMFVMCSDEVGEKLRIEEGQ